jgi:hypothetical protein
VSLAITPVTPAVAPNVGGLAECVERFEARTLPPWAFGHREHLLVAWTYLRAAPFENAAARFIGNLKRFAAHHGATGKFHATVTWALLMLLAEAIDEHPTLDFDTLLARHPELLDTRKLLNRFYDLDALDSDRARRTPLLPR